VKGILEMGRRAFTLVELLVVIVMLGILAAIAVPRFSGATDDARSASTQSTLAGVRSAIATFRMNAVINGNDPFPTLQTLTDGTVVKFDIPANPYTGVSGVQAVSQGQATSRTVTGSSAGWNYYFDNNASPPIAIFYANNDDPSAVDDGSGGFLGANEL
jgi:prepilin-type N-terminal cleavage/methylation domain-containing protein